MILVCVQLVGGVYFAGKCKTNYGEVKAVTSYSIQRILVFNAENNSSLLEGTLSLLLYPNT